MKRDEVLNFACFFFITIGKRHSAGGGQNSGWLYKTVFSTRMNLTLEHTDMIEL